MPEIDEDQYELLKDRLVRCQALIHWLALPWQSNDPDFAAYDHYGHDLPENVELEETWFEVVRGGVRPENVEEKIRVVCDQCSGTGNFFNTHMKCSYCVGNGYVEATRFVPMSAPPVGTQE